MTVCRSVFGPGAPLLLQNSGEYEKWRSLNEDLEHDWGCSDKQPLLTTSTSSEEEWLTLCSHLRKYPMRLLCTIYNIYIYIYIYIYIQYIYIYNFISLFLYPRDLNRRSASEEERCPPIFIPSIWSICDSHEHISGVSGACTARNSGERWNTQSVTWSAIALMFLCLCLGLDILELSMLLEL